MNTLPESQKQEIRLDMKEIDNESLNFFKSILFLLWTDFSFSCFWDFQIFQVEIIQYNTIQTNAVTLSFGKYKVLNDSNLQVPAGSIFGFPGPNGAGKSTK